MTDQTIFERCVEAVTEAGFVSSATKTRAVIQTIIDNTPSPQAAEELNRILGEA